MSDKTEEQLKVFIANRAINGKVVEVSKEETTNLLSAIRYLDYKLKAMQGLLDGQANVIKELEQYKAIAHELADKSKTVISRWDSPLWKDIPNTAQYINELRKTLAKFEEMKK